MREHVLEVPCSRGVTLGAVDGLAHGTVAGHLIRAVS